jgi:serine/threonine-protein kinase
LLLIDELCDQFEEGWLAGTPVPLEAVVSTVPEPVRPELFRELISVEIEYRSKVRRPVTLAEARERFADLGAWVEQTIEDVFGSAVVPPELRRQPLKPGSPLTPRPEKETATVDLASGEIERALQLKADRPDHLPPAPSGYDMIRKIGSGGMGDVYLARHHASEREVAMKLVRGGAGAVDRFLVELRALSALDHPNIVRVLSEDFYRADPYFTMEYAPGGTLGDLVKQRGPLPPAEAARMTLAVARAVAFAHGKDILHRDLKPSNVLLAEDGTPKVSDFGLAKRLDRDDGVTVGTGGLGTPGYMPPEQISSRNGGVGPASDVYGLGATLYHLLTGRPPFEGDTAAEAMQRVLDDPPSRPRALRAELPLELEGIVVKCLEKDPAERYPSAAALIADLERFLAGRKPAAPPLTPLRRVRRWVGRKRRRVAAGAGVLLAMAGLVMLTPWLTQPPPQKPAPDPIEEIRKQLADGKPVTLIGPKGEPRYYRWALDQGEFVTLPDGTFAALNRFDTLLELLPDPGIDRYRITAQVRQYDSTARREGGITTYQVGIYFGYHFQMTGDGTRIHTFSSIDVADYEPVPATRFPAQTVYCDRLVVHPQLLGRGGHTVILDDAPCSPARTLPGPWRDLEVEVTPDRIKAVFGKTVEHDAAGIAARTATLRKTLVTPPLSQFQYVLGVNLPDWSPRRALGLRFHGTTVAVRNFIVTPLPLPHSGESL